jgi:hypothetical protein
MNPQLTSSSTFQQPRSSHQPTGGETCPSCGQQIPTDKFEEISGRIASRERQQALSITAKLEQQYALERSRADAKAKSDLELVQRQSAEREGRRKRAG